jgi:hypothetical protein
MGGGRLFDSDVGCCTRLCSTGPPSESQWLPCRGSCSEVFDVLSVGRPQRSIMERMSDER